MEVLLFGGTMEGRKLVEWLDARASCKLVACTATSYGTSLLEATSNRVLSLTGPLSAQQKRGLMQGHDFCCIVDATHPYAQHISASIDDLSRAYGVDVVRLAREDPQDGEWGEALSLDEAARRVAQTKGNVLLTTGAKEVASFVAALPDYRDRLYVRILPVQGSLQHVLDLGIPVSHVIAMQGPFSARLNAALIEEYDIGCVVTKQSGAAGGFSQKVEAARACGAELVVIGRPPVPGGVSLDQAKRLLEERYGL